MLERRNLKRETGKGLRTWSNVNTTHRASPPLYHHAASSTGMTKKETPSPSSSSSSLVRPRALPLVLRKGRPVKKRPPFFSLSLGQPFRGQGLFAETMGKKGTRNQRRQKQQRPLVRPNPIVSIAADEDLFRFFLILFLSSFFSSSSSQRLASCVLSDRSFPSSFPIHSPL